MNDQTDVVKCRRCGHPVIENRDNYQALEGMHWLCFHLEYEHGDHDPDASCGPHCFWGRSTGKLRTS